MPIYIFFTCMFCLLLRLCVTNVLYHSHLVILGVILSREPGAMTPIRKSGTPVAPKCSVKWLHCAMCVLFVLHLNA